jgi:hypothetical protein
MLSPTGRMLDRLPLGSYVERSLTYLGSAELAGLDLKVSNTIRRQVKFAGDLRIGATQVIGYLKYLCPVSS